MTVFIIVIIIGWGILRFSRFMAWKYTKKLEQQGRDLYNKEHGY